jgi:hypothetical protein
VPLDAPDGAKEHGADLARLRVREPSRAQLAALLVPGAIEGNNVQVRVEPASMGYYLRRGARRTAIRLWGRQTLRRAARQLGQPR